MAPIEKRSATKAAAGHSPAAIDFIIASLTGKPQKASNAKLIPLPGIELFLFFWRFKADNPI
ncbi:MAG: hypothetical protein Pars2KO_15560 [Parasphingorhabdus sp.]